MALADARFHRTDGEAVSRTGCEAAPPQTSMQIAIDSAGDVDPVFGSGWLLVGGAFPHAGRDPQTVLVTLSGATEGAHRLALYRDQGVARRRIRRVW